MQMRRKKSAPILYMQRAVLQDCVVRAPPLVLYARSCRVVIVMSAIDLSALIV